MVNPSRFGLPAGVPAFTLTVPSGTVSADLTNFPLMIDLAEMPSGFWTAVRSDGGNVRAYASDGVTQIPIDLTYINKTRELGRMFVKTDLLTASDNTIVLKVLAPTETALAVTDTYGRNAVWSDFEVVWVFPSDANRTGKSYTQSMASLLAHSEWMRTDYDNLTGAPHNGISTDGTHFISCDDIILRRMNMSYVVQQTVTDINTALSAMTGLSNFDHMGDPVCVGTSTFFTVTTNDATYRRFLVEYRTSDLTLLNAWEMTGAQRVFGATVCYDGTNLLLFSYTDDNTFIKYTTSGSYVGDVSITGRPSEMDDYQGATVLPSGNILVSGGINGIYEITAAGAYVRKAYTDPHASIMEGLEYHSGTLWLLKGNGVLITLRDDVHQDFRKLHGGDYIYADLPTFDTFTMGTTIYWTTTNSQQGFISAYNLTTSNGARVAYDEGPDRLDAFATTDSWIVPPVNDNPGAYSTRRLGLKHNGTTERKLHINGAVSDTDAGIAANPGGTGNARFLLNASRPGFEAGECYFQTSWLRLSYLSDAWMAADGENHLTPATFYTIT